MGLHRLEIEVDDEMLSRIDAAAARTAGSRAKVVVETLADHLPMDLEVEAASVEEQRDKLQKWLDEATRHSSHLSDEEVLREVRDARGDE
ncbi:MULTISPECIES: hypothetical protein [unclassified Rhizobium]|uniref:hypothetical protein n=1 Tax=unclassified Rhizobium TaxID=2613769 RepID=UPI003D281E2E